MIWKNPMNFPRFILKNQDIVDYANFIFRCQYKDICMRHHTIKPTPQKVPASAPPDAIYFLSLSYKILDFLVNSKSFRAR